MIVGHEHHGVSKESIALSDVRICVADQVHLTGPERKRCIFDYVCVAVPLDVDLEANKSEVGLLL